VLGDGTITYTYKHRPWTGSIKPSLQQFEFFRFSIFSRFKSIFDMTDGYWLFWCLVSRTNPITCTLLFWTMIVCGNSNYCFNFLGHIWHDGVLTQFHIKLAWGGVRDFAFFSLSLMYRINQTESAIFMYLCCFECFPGITFSRYFNAVVKHGLKTYAQYNPHHWYLHHALKVR
jgi:hypothetical protein